MLRRSAAKAVQELNLLRSCTQDTLQGAGQQCCQWQLQHCMAQQEITPNQIGHHDQPERSPQFEAHQGSFKAPGEQPWLLQQHKQQQQLRHSPRHMEQQLPAVAAGQQRAGMQPAQQLHQQYLQLQQLQHNQHSQHLPEVQGPLQQQRAGQPKPSSSGRSRNSSSTSGSTTSSSGIGITSIPGIVAEFSPDGLAELQPVPHPDDAFSVSSLQQQYQLTLDSLHMGHSRNIAQLAQMFDPHAVLAAPDKGAAILEALMFGAAKLGDMQLLAQLLRCCKAADIPLSPTGHTAVLHGLAHSGQASRAKRWLQEEVPKQVISSSMLRAVVQPLLQQGHVQTADEILQWVGSRWQPGSTAADGTAALGSNGSDSLSTGNAAAGCVALLLQDSQQVVPCMRLMVAGARRNIAAVQAEWTALQQQQQEVVEQLQENSSYHTPHHHPHLMNVSAWASYVSALCKACKTHQDTSCTKQQLLRHAVRGLANVYHTTAWNRWAKVNAARISARQELGSPAAAAEGAVSLWHHQQQQGQQAWQQLRHDLGSISWRQLDPSAVLPQEVTSAVDRVEKDALARALDAAIHLAADGLDEQWMDELLKTAAVLKAMPGSWGFDALLNFKLWHGDTPEAIEELLGELMGWGVTPTLAHYEHVAEAYALHGKHGSAVAVLDRIYAAGHTPVLRTYNRLLHGLATRGELLLVGRVYLRLKMQGLVPDEQTLRALFKCVRMYASNVRVHTARKLAQLKPGDRKSAAVVLSQRAALFASAYSQLVDWQGELVTAGLKHTDASMHHLLSALERLGAAEDCVQLAKLHEEMKPGTYTAHRFALQAAGRMRSVSAASKSADLAARLASGDQLSRQDYCVLISTQFWLNRDHQQLLQTIAAMRAAGHELDQSVLLQVLHVYCHYDMWSEALRVLDDVAAGRVGVISGLLGAEDASSMNSRQRSSKYPNSAQPVLTQELDSGATSTARRWPRSYQALDDPARQAGQDALWHVVMRKLWEQRAADSLLNEFLQRMSPEQLQRFKLLYKLRPSPDGGYTMQPMEDWQVPAEKMDLGEDLQPQLDEYAAPKTER